MTFESSASANLMTYLRNAPDWWRSEIIAVNMKTNRRSNSDRYVRHGCIFNWRRGTALVADKIKRREHTNECEKTGSCVGKVDQKAK
jgi:hypothetical protein